ncbi:MAG: hypothetical protein E7157_01135 [Lactobacillales bacterium]|nr:hypothetical protein [Lactobacillales bacterium]
MKQGVGMSFTINLIVIFIVVTFAFLVATLNYYKAYKVNNAISDSIEKYEGYNDLAITEINRKLTTLGYVNNKKGCDKNSKYGTLVKTDVTSEQSNFSYCVYEQDTNDDTGKFKYVIITYLNMNIPIINATLNLPVKTTTEPIYYFSE